jgi:transcriptional regulator with XRE-family HTH domain
MDEHGELGDFLQSRRARVTPESVGIPSDSRRRVPGLRREELAHLSGISVDYVTRLEQGRATQPSEQVLDALARVLRLDQTERGHLHRLARHRRRRAGRPGSERLRPQLVRLLHLMTDFPAMIVNHRLDVLAFNRLAASLYGFDDLAGFDRNIARQIFMSPAGESLYLDWDKCTADTVGQLRLAAGQYPDDQVLAGLIGELTMHSRRFTKLWAGADVRARSHGVKGLRHPMVGELRLHQENFALPDDSGQELITLTAEPGSPAEDNLRLLAGLTESSKTG